MQVRVKTKKILQVLEKNGFHTKDIEFLNGYFIFDHGKDMVVHFHIKECKGWKFGIWWDTEKEDEYTFFGQYEKEIDKFKPSASTFVKENIKFGKEYVTDIEYYLVTMLNFIHKHPYVAWSYEMKYHFYSWEYISDWRARWSFYKYNLEEFILNKKLHKLEKKYVKLLKLIAEETLEDYEIKEDEGCIPKYHVICKNFKEGKVSKKGWYNIDLAEEVSYKLLKKIKRYDARANRTSYRAPTFDGYLGVMVKNDKSAN